MNRISYILFLFLACSLPNTGSSSSFSGSIQAVAGLTDKFRLFIEERVFEDELLEVEESELPLERLLRARLESAGDHFKDAAYEMEHGVLGDKSAFQATIFGFHGVFESMDLVYLNLIDETQKFDAGEEKYEFELELTKYWGEFHKHYMEMVHRSGVFEEHFGELSAERNIYISHLDSIRNMIDAFYECFGMSYYGYVKQIESHSLGTALIPSDLVDLLDMQYERLGDRYDDKQMFPLESLKSVINYISLVHFDDIPSIYEHLYRIENSEEAAKLRRCLEPFRRFYFRRFTFETLNMRTNE